MSKDKNTERDNRIANEVVVDAYTDEEEMMGWYYYIEGSITESKPLAARWKTRSSSIPVEVVGMPSEEECERDMFVNVLVREGETSDVFTARLTDIEIPDLPDDHPFAQALGDWLYWIGQE
jgi:hypothetical protein